MEQQCPTCGAAVTSEQQFCARCGAQLISEVAAPVITPIITPVENPGPILPPPHPPLPVTPTKKPSNPLIWILGLGGLGLGLLICGVIGFGLLTMLGNQVSDVGTSVQATLEAAVATVEPGEDPPTPLPEDDGTGGKGPVPTLATAISEGAVVVRENFDIPALSPFEPAVTESAIYRFVDGAYAIAISTTEYITWEPLEDRYTDASVAIDTTISGPTDGAAALLFRMQDDDNFYMFVVNGERSYQIDLLINNEWTTLVSWTENDAIAPLGESNQLRVEMRGNTFEFYVNDQLVDTVEDDTFARGEVAFAANSFSESGVEIRFDNLIVRDLSR